jgi:hypothetical protein
MTLAKHWRHILGMKWQICSFAYGAAEGNGRMAQRLYQDRLPNWRLPHHSTFASKHQRLRDITVKTHAELGRPCINLTLLFGRPCIDNYTSIFGINSRQCAQATGIYSALSASLWWRASAPRIVFYTDEILFNGENTITANIIFFLQEEARMQQLSKATSKKFSLMCELVCPTSVRRLCLDLSTETL